MIGLARGTVQIVSYHQEWQELFVIEATLLRAVMGDAVLDVEHIGSTSIEGMPAKPIIDLMVAVDSLDAAHFWIPQLQALSYEWRPDEETPDRIFFAKGSRSKRTHHLSLAEKTSHFYASKLLFRDFLRSHPEAFAEYWLLKQRLALNHPDERTAYTKGKQEFVERIIRLATEKQ